MIRFVVMTLCIVVLLLFSFANLHVVELKTVFSEPIRASLAFLVAGAFGAGVFSAALVGMHRALKGKKKERTTGGRPRHPALPLPPKLRAPSHAGDASLPSWRS